MDSNKAFYHFSRNRIFLSRVGQSRYFYNVQECRFIAHIDAAAAQNLKKGERVALSVKGSDASVPFTGTVEFIAPVVDTSSDFSKSELFLKIKPGNYSGSKLTKLLYSSKHVGRYSIISRFCFRNVERKLRILQKI
jgi:hypothetical protein